MSSEKEIIKKIAKANFIKQRSRNIIAIIAIFMTTILITGVMSVGFSFEDAWRGYNDLAAGPGADGAILGKENELAKIDERNDVEWASLIYKGSAEPVILPQYIGGMTVELLAPDEVYYENNGIKLLSGNYPETDDEILISNTLAIALDIDINKNNNLMLKYYVPDEMGTVEQEKDFHISGYYTNPLAGIADVYEEIYCAKDFIEEYNPILLTASNNIYIKLKKDMDSQKAYEVLNQINEEVGGEGVTMKVSGSSSIGTIIVAILVALLVMFAAYLIIYNIFYISLINDIRFYGTLKTLGTTSRQIKIILERQMWILMLPGLISGVVLGNILGIKITPFLISSFSENLNYIKNPTNIPIVSIMGAFFTIVTVVLSCWKSFRMVSKISPVEAAHYRGKKGNKIFTVLSLSLSIIIFLLVFTITCSQDTEKEAMRYHTTDFTIENRSVHALSNSPYSPIDPKVCEALEAEPFVDEMDIFYNALSLPEYTIDDKGNKIYNLFGRIRADGEINDETQEIIRVYGEDSTKVSYEGDWELQIMGIPSNCIEREMKGKDVVDGVIDQELFSKGNYILYQRLYSELDKDESIDQDKLIKAGDKLEISFYNNQTRDYDKREVTVMAVIQNGKGSEYGPSAIDINTIILSDSMFKSIYPDWEKMISVIKINVDDTDNYAEQESRIKEVLGENGGNTATMRSMYASILHAEKNKEMIALVGGFFSIFLALIGIVNVINTFVTEVIAQRLEYTRMQAVGMTNRQLYFHLVGRNSHMCLLGLLIGIPIAAIMSNMVGNMQLFTGIKWFPFIIGVILTFLMLAFLSCMIAFFLVKYLNAKSIVERLRSEE